MGVCLMFKEDSWSLNEIQNQQYNNPLVNGSVIQRSQTYTKVKFRCDRYKYEDLKNRGALLIMSHNMVAYTRIKFLYRHSMPLMIHNNQLF